MPWRSGNEADSCTGCGCVLWLCHCFSELIVYNIARTCFGVVHPIACGQLSLKRAIPKYRGRFTLQFTGPPTPPLWLLLSPGPPGSLSLPWLSPPAPGWGTREPVTLTSGGPRAPMQHGGMHARAAEERTDAGKGRDFAQGHLGRRPRSLLTFGRRCSY